MINHSLRTYKCSFSYFLLLYTAKYAISLTIIMECDVTRCVVCIFNKVESRKKFYQRSFIVISSDLCNVIKKMLDKMSRQKKIALKSKYALGAWSTCL